MPLAEKAMNPMLYWGVEAKGFMYGSKMIFDRRAKYILGILKLMSSCQCFFKNTPKKLRRKYSSCEKMTL